ncbi:MAG: c-type cytochrome biogenesis protein CcmI [Gammaproteobacteria bacterium]|nr:MAG: c-type cytochrome biogenesis protein CcmI [Gammaproteobacteria bacterium]
MTTVFWLSAASMSVIALLFAIVPLLRRDAGATVSRQLLNTALIKEQLNELQADLEAGKLEPDAYQAARHDLERELLNDTQAAPEAGQQEERSGRWAIGIFGLLIPALAVFLYLQLGAAPLLEQPARPPVAQKPAQDTAHPLEDMVQQLAIRLQEDPDNAEGWVMLGRSYAALDRYQEAANAYAQARRIAGDHPQLLVDSADIMVMASGGRFTPEAGELLERALQVQPENAKGLWLMGHYKYQGEDLQGAVDYWQRAAAQLPPDSEDTRAIRQQIEQAESRLVAAGGTLAPAAETPASPAPAAEAKAVEVSVRLDPALSAQASAQDTVFIFARAAQGPRMPLAIVRKRVSELPVTVTLDDSLAMSPAMVMSNFSEVTVGARVSKSGNAMPQSGDLQGSVTPVQVQAGASVEVVINEVMP